MPFINIESLNEKEVFPGYRGSGGNTYRHYYLYVFGRVDAGAAHVPEHSLHAGTVRECIARCI